MSSQAVIIGDSRFRKGSGALKEYPSFRASAQRYYESLNKLVPFRGNCTLIPDPAEPDAVVDADTVMDGIMNAVKEASGAEDTLLIVYVGHGMAWDNLHGNEVHLAMYGSRDDRPWSWLPYSSIRREIRKKKDGLRIFIADCCYSNFLHAQGAADHLPENAFALMEKDQATAIFTAVDPEGRNTTASPIGCELLDSPWRECTLFSGHFLKILSEGSRSAGDMLSLGDMRDEVRQAMEDCRGHQRGGLILRGGGDSTPFVENALSPDTPRVLPARTTRQDWVDALRTGRQWPIDKLLEQPEMAGWVSWDLWNDPETAARNNASRIDREANRAYRGDSRKYATYWFVRDGLSAA